MAMPKSLFCIVFAGVYGFGFQGAPGWSQGPSQGAKSDPKALKSDPKAPKMGSQIVIFLILFKGLGPRVPQGGPKDPPRVQKVTQKLQKVKPKLSKLGPKAIKRQQKNEKTGSRICLESYWTRGENLRWMPPKCLPDAPSLIPSPRIPLGFLLPDSSSMILFDSSMRSPARLRFFD